MRKKLEKEEKKRQAELESEIERQKKEQQTLKEKKRVKNIVAINENVSENFNILIKDVYNEGWLYQVFPDNLVEEIKILKKDTPV